MKKISAWILLLGLLTILQFGYGNSPAFAHEKEESESAIHEMPASDNCALIIMQIRQLVYALKQNARKIALLQPSGDATTVNEENREQPQEDEQQLKLLQEKEFSLRHRIDVKEQQLEACNQKSDTSLDK
jgi:hypothetical protein